MRHTRVMDLTDENISVNLRKIRKNRKLVSLSIRIHF